MRKTEIERYNYHEKVEEWSRENNIKEERREEERER
jgi:hypothetical protein